MTLLVQAAWEGANRESQPSKVVYPVALLQDKVSTYAAD